MSFSINTNIASLQAQNYLQLNNQFQNKTISRVSSGLRIVNSGDDAAGLAIANGYRSDESVLAQGIRNANDGLSQLQIIDGGANNISQLLDRARTLATQSASGTFTGNRATLNSEFQSVLTEIDRQSQAIGLNQGGQFAQLLNVFVGGGKASPGGSAASAIANGNVQLDLSRASIDTKSLGLKGVQVLGGTPGTTDLSNGSATSVTNIVGNATNIASELTQGYATFSVYGAGFSASGAGAIKLTVNLTGVSDTGTLVNALNSAISSAGSVGNQQATAFKNANITASINTDATGKQQLTFNSSSTAFQVQGDDQVATGLLGSFSSGSTGNNPNPIVTGASAVSNAATGANTAAIRLVGAGLPAGAANDITITYAGGETRAAQVATINAAIAANATLAATGISASLNGSNDLVFTGKAGETFEVQVAGDLTNNLGFGSYQASTGGSGTFDYNTIDAAAASAAKTQHIQISVGGGATADLGVLTGTGTELTDIATLNTAFQSNAITRAAGLTAADDGAGNIRLTAAGGVNFRLNAFGGTGNAFGFGSFAGAASSAASTQSVYAAKDNFDAGGANQSQATSGADVLAFTGLRNLGDAQTISISAADPSGNQHNLNVSLTTVNAATLDDAVTTINNALQSSNDATLQSLVSIKELNNGGTTEGIRFLSATSAFKISLGSTTNGVGVSDGGTQGTVLSSVVSAGGGTADISNASAAQDAVTALASAVTILGDAQASVGKGENQFTFAANLAQSQLTNETAAESQIRDANLATESANLTKAQILSQAGVAALSQANSAPQQLLSLLQGK